MCCTGCAYCAISIKPEPDVDEDDNEISMPEAVMRTGGNASVIDLNSYSVNN